VRPKGGAGGSVRPKGPSASAKSVVGQVDVLTLEDDAFIADDNDIGNDDADDVSR
jgi:hypothetical protein